MRILICAYAFAPSIGGVETSTLAIAEGLTRRGHDVTVATRTPADATDDADENRFCYQIVRQPGLLCLWRLATQSDIVLHNSMSLRFAWPLLVSPRPWVVLHQGWLRRADGRIGWRMRLRRALLRLAHSVATNRALAADIPGPCTIIPNPYRERIFRRSNSESREFDLAFLGRLVSDKGADLLVEALVILARHELRPRLQIIGEGPERARLECLVGARGLGEQVVFQGARDPASAAALLNRSRVLVVPSRWPEPFGIVALEGLACGCGLIVAGHGGLPEAAGPASTCFRPGDAEDLARVIAARLEDESEPLQSARIEAHLERHTQASVSDAYLRLFAAILSGRAG